MRYGTIDRFQSGVAVPVSALRSAQNLGVGEFADLVDLGHWCTEVGLDLIQVLPLTDTGDDPSPYAGLSAWALHPIHLRLEEVEGAGPWREEIARFRRTTHNDPASTRHRVARFKGDILEQIFTRVASTIGPALEEWSHAHPWVRSYAAFRVLKARFDGRPWWEWSQVTGVEEVWRTDHRRTLFHVFLQHELDRQLTGVVQQLDTLGVRLKGDLPILVAEDSVDVWTHPQCFRRDVAVGAPPDMFATEGQNWSFPSYRWDHPDTMSWWVERIQHAARWFHAYRIDHVLGFFRIWEIPRAYGAGMLGAFQPAVALTLERLRRTGFSPPQIEAYLAPEGDPHRPLPDERELLFLEDPAAREEQLARFWDRILVRQGEALSFRWEFETTAQFRRLPEADQTRLQEIAAEVDARRQRAWTRAGRERLGALVRATDMLPCAEDLGSDADCVPPVLAELGILKLCVDRWWRAADEPGATFVPPAEFPRLSVATPSTHDTSTLRGWWAEDPAAHRPYLEVLGISGTAPADLDPEWIGRILERQFQANSLLSVVGLWEMTELDPQLRAATPGAQRINVPGTPAAGNWGYRMPLPIKDLHARSHIVDPLREMITARRARSL